MDKIRHAQPTEEEFVQEIESHSARILNCKIVHRAAIKTGPKTYKFACILEFVNPTTNQVSHRELRVNSYPFRVDTGIDYSVKNRLCRWDCRDQEISRLRALLECFEGINEAGSYRAIPAEQHEHIDSLVAKLDGADLSAPQLIDLMSALADHSSDIRQLPELGEANKLRMVAAAIRVAHRTTALGRLVDLINADEDEHEFQRLLDQNWWMLGGHYIEHIPRRQWTTDETVDIMLRTADNYFEIVELKRSSPALFKSDHSKWIVGAAVNDAVNQAAHYIAEIERTRPAIFQRYDVDLYKLRAKVLIGFIGDGEEDCQKKRECLRMYNSHLHRIEVLTYDQVLRIGENVITANAGESGQEHVSLNDDSPF